LFLARELLAYRLNAVHNLFYYHTLMRTIHQALADETMDQFVREFFSRRGENITEAEGGETLC
jgi:queuine tRNA-ribosyltransferase